MAVVGRRAGTGDPHSDARGLQRALLARAAAFGSRPRATLDRVPRSAWLLAIVVFGALAVVETAILVGLILETPGSWEFGQDYSFYRDIGARWLADGSYYLPRQLAGPSAFVAMQDVLYPPSALPLFVLAVFTPAAMWWAIPAAVLSVAIHRWRPAPWAIAVVVVLMAWPRSIGYVLFGNTDIWVMASVAGGLLWGWPAALIALKPSMIPLTLVGLRSRSWFVAVGVLAGATLLTFPSWLDYAKVMADTRLGWDYSLGSLPLAFVPLALWAGRRRTRRSVG